MQDCLYDKGDISKHLPEQTQTVSAIYAHYKKTGDAEPQRGYLGASIIGHPCKRYLWYCFRHCCKSELSGRIYRLFETGDLEENRFAKNLQAIGCTVHQLDNNGQQFAVSALGGHFSGHMDGCAIGIPEAPQTWHVLEFKTHKAKYFRELVQKGIKTAQPRHFAQMQIYMHLTGIKRALYLAVNKDTDELYSERIHYDKQFAEDLTEKAKQIITSNVPPERISERPDYYQCKWCDTKDVCFGAQSPKPTFCVSVLSCRQCCHATPSLDGCDGRWICEKHQRALTKNDQARTCDDHLILPDLLPLFDVVDYGVNEEGKDLISFENIESGYWEHGQSDHAFSSKELTILSMDKLKNVTIKAAKETFGAEATDCTENILDRYQIKDGCFVTWKGKSSELIAAWKKYYNESLPYLTPIATSVLPTHSIAEYKGERIAVVYPIEKKAEIREHEIPF